ncbi:extracellular solute-binding protein [Paenibacillus sp.]|uniref:extracellular solute-binding protein n=1 Tax=Paenibacillus sp. TaxID=58172 RepID=UPI002D2E979C|nr:extracellular solute-binding protein [Paenibacillus sp.]HZG58099.1 extracellular solute-binding protein [Paenibacillus sp.]
MKHVRKAALLVSFAVVFGVFFAACTSPPEESASPDAPEPTGSESGGEAGSEVLTYDFHFVMSGYQDQFQGGNAPKYYRDVADEINRRLEKERGIRLNFVPLAYPQEGQEEKINLELAAGKQIDLIRSNNDGFKNIYNKYVDKNVVIDLKPLLEKYGQNILKAYGQNAWDELSRDGKIYAIPQVDFPYGYAAWIRNDWLKTANLGVPKSLSEFEQVLKTFRDSDFDGNGKADTIPMTGNINWLEGWFLGIFTDHPGDYVDGDTVKSKYEDPGYKEFLSVMQRWYAEGYMDDSIFDAGTVLNVSTDLIGKNRLGIEVSNIFSLEWGPMRTIYDTRKEIEMKFVSPLDDVRSYPTVGISNQYVFIPTNSKNPEAVIKYLDWIYEKEENFVLTYPGLGIEGKTFVKDASNAPDLPQAEKDAGVEPGTLLSGPYSNVAIFQYSQVYLPAVTPNETRTAYAVSSSIDDAKYFVPVTKKIGSPLPERLDLKLKDSETVANEYVQKVIQGKATYDQMIAAWKAAGGEEVYGEYTRLYREMK